jgi:hypothetical protein
MMKPAAILLLFLFCFTPALLRAQQHATVKGLVCGTDSAIMADASVSLLRVKDSSLAASTITDEKGWYQFNRQDTGQYLIYITAVGHKPHLGRMQVSPPPAKKTDTVYLKIQAKTEETITVKGLVVPVTVKKDTLEFNPSAWKSRPNDAVVDLLKRMPGFKIESDGSLSYQGEKITSVLVDGKPFQLENASTLNTLPVSVIERIQVIDQKPKEEKYNKNDNGERQKVLNLTVKKDKKKGWFGTAGASWGTNNQRDEKLNMNRFNNKRKLSFSLGDNGTTQRQGGLDNKSQAQNGDFSFRDGWDKENDYSFRSSVTQSRGNNTRSSTRQTFLQNDTVLIGRNQGGSTYNNQSQNGGGDFEWHPDSTSELSVEAGVTLNNNQNQSFSSSTTSNNYQQPVNRSLTSSSATNNSRSFNGNVNYNKQIDTNGRNFYVRTTFSTSTTGYNGYNKADNEFFNPDSTLKRSDRLNQYRQNNSRNYNYQTYAGYNMPLGKKYYLSFSYSFTYNSNQSVRTTYDYDTASGKFSQFSPLQSNGFRNQSFNHRQNISLGRRLGQLYANIRLGLLQSKQLNRNLDSSFTQTQRFFNILPGFGLNYYHKTKGNFRFNYNGNTTQPSISQRQPVIDNSNPLFVRTGNPDLRPEYNNQFGLNFSKGNRAKGRMLSFNADFNNTLNKIMDRVQYDAEGKQFSRPENVNGNYRGGIGINYSYPISQKNKSYGGFGVGGNKSRSEGFLNGLRNTGRSYTLTAGAQAGLNVKEWLHLNSNVSFNHTESRYSISTRNNRSFNSYTLGGDVDIHLPGEWRLQSNINYNNRGSQVDFGRETTLWNMSASKLFFDKKLSVGVRVSDLLQQNIGYNRSVGNNYIEETEGSVPGRFLLLTATYTFKKFGGR